MLKTYEVPNRFVGPIPCTKEQYTKAVDLCARFNQTFATTDFMQDAFGTAHMIGATFGSMYIGILPDGSSHS